MVIIQEQASLTTKQFKKDKAMIQEIDMTPGQAIVFVLLLLFLIWKLWHLKGSQSSPEPLRATKKHSGGEYTTEELRPRIWGLYSACRTQVQLKETRT